MSSHSCNGKLNNNQLLFLQIFIMIYDVKYKLYFIFLCLYTSKAIPSQYLLNEDESQEKDLAVPLSSSKYLTKESELSKSPAFSLDSDDDSTMIISKLSDRDLISLLQKQPKQSSFDDFDVADEKSNLKQRKEPSSQAENRASDQGSAFFRIDNKEVEPFNFNIGADPKYLAHQKIKNLLHSKPTQNLFDLDSYETDQNKELLFDILTEQLKKLCCKSRKPKKNRKKVHLYEPLLNIPKSHNEKPAKDILQYEQMFLVINDEIKSDHGSDIVYVDPESLNKNSSVILLGPITTPLSDSQLKTVMNSITTELSKPEYTPLLQELSGGKFNRDNTRLVKSLVSGSNTRRYIKPHRCKQRYPLSQGPKWLICTGYLNINTPSIYD